MTVNLFTTWNRKSFDRSSRYFRFLWKKKVCSTGELSVPSSFTKTNVPLARATYVRHRTALWGLFNVDHCMCGNSQISNPPELYCRTQIGLVRKILASQKNYLLTAGQTRPFQFLQSTLSVDPLYHEWKRRSFALTGCDEMLQYR